jgi:hypothetical protein
MGATAATEQAVDVGGRWRSSRFARAEREREGEGAGQRAQMGEGRWASRAWGSKGARGFRRGRRTCVRGRVHDGEIVGERLETADRWGRRDREKGAGACWRTSVDRSGPRDKERERGREARSGWRRQVGPACQAVGARERGRARGLG